MSLAPVTWNVGMTLEELEKQAIYAALRWFGNNKEATARALGVSVKTIYNKLAVYEGKAPNGLRTEEGLRMEQDAETDTPKQSVPVQERQEIQSMSLKPSSARGPDSRNNRSRR